MNAPRDARASVQVQIVDFRPELRAHFHRLNAAWLQKYFRMEPIDERVLAHPEPEILAPGGAILFALLEDEVVGTCALKRESEGVYELTKMAVDEAHQGLGLGRRLIEAAIAEFQRRGGAKLFLETNSKLIPAVRLYESVGFEHQPGGKPDSHYERSDVYMIWRADATPSRRDAPAGGVRAAIEADLAQIAALFDAVIARGDSYPFEHALDAHAQRNYWFGPGVSSYVWDQGGRVLGVYKLVPNQAGRGAHVANASYLVAPDARGRGVGRRLGEDSLVRARDAGFRAMQFNFVVSTNDAAVRLWQSLGFDIVGRLPGAYRHAQLGFVDACVMFRTL